MFKLFLSSLRMLFFLTLLTGVAYPLVVTGLAQVIFPYQANGSLITRDNVVVGSELIGQDVTDERYFWPRPSATGYNPLPSGGSNLGTTSDGLKQTVAERTAAIRAANNLAADAPIPADLLYASASGLDPHISPEAARLQIERVAQARGFTADQRTRLTQLVEQMVEPPQLAILGEARVNVLRLNLALDELK